MHERIRPNHIAQDRKHLAHVSHARLMALALECADRACEGAHCVAGVVHRVTTARTIAIKIKPVTTIAPPHKGAVTHHHDQVIEPTSFNTRNTKNIIPNNPIFIYLSLPFV